MASLNGLYDSETRSYHPYTDTTVERVHRISAIGRETSSGEIIAKSNSPRGIIPLYRLDQVSGKIVANGHSHMRYDFIVESEEKEFDFPEGKAKGYEVIYRWSTYPFLCIVKSSDVDIYTPNHPDVTASPKLHKSPWYFQ